MTRGWWQNRILSCVLTLLSSVAMCVARPVYSMDSAEFGHGWNTIVPGGQTRCANGEPYSFHVKQGDPGKVLIFFNGGGACSSGDVCDVHTPPTTYRFLATEPHNDPRTRDGVFAFNNPDNPLRDWSQVFVSYCTGDVHLGARDMTYKKSDGSEILIYHRGKTNAQAALDWAYTYYPDPDTVLVAGSSAGGVAAPYYAAVVAEHYINSKIIHFSGGAGAFGVMKAPVSWNVMAQMPDWPELENFVEEDITFADLYLIASDRHPEIGFHQYNTAYDRGQKPFLESAGEMGTVHAVLTMELAKLKRLLPTFSSYTAHGDFHTLLRFDELYKKSVNGVSALKWVTDLSLGDSVEDVSCGAAAECIADYPDPTNQRSAEQE